MNKGPENIEKTILSRSYVVFVLLFVFGITVLGKTFVIQYKEGEQLRQKFKKMTIAVRNIEAMRGNIYAQDGTLLATSIPIYEIRMDTKADGLTNTAFQKHIDSLSIQLSILFKDKSAKAYIDDIRTARRRGDRYFLIQKNVRYNTLQKLRKFKFFSRGKNKSGLIIVQHSRREKPFNSLASRTIGYINESAQVGLESAYDKELKGVGGKQLMKKISGGVWMPINDEDELEPQDGYDIYTSIDINLQDVAEQALYNQLNQHEADHGCVVLMEVATGDIKAMVNLSRNEDGSYAEKFNYAIGESTEPGSTFKLASLMVALEDGYVTLNDTIDTEKGKAWFYGEDIEDSHEGGYGKITLKNVFEYSSNVGVAKTIQQYYGKQPQKFIDGLRKLGVDKMLSLEIPGEGKPYLKSVSDKSWSGLSLPWISHGYEVTQTPLQILSFYNAVANNGVYVRPRFVKQIKNKAEIIRDIPVKILNTKICSQKTLQSAHEMLEGVVQNGTAINLKNPIFKIAGKTGTAQISNGKYGYKYESKISHQASFVGYFPADNPKYSCIVVVNAPSKNVYYANLVAGPIFKEVAYKIYATSTSIHDPINLLTKTQPHLSFIGYSNDINKVYTEVGTKPINLTSDQWVKANEDESFQKVNYSKKELKNVVGTSLKDALYILENQGYIVSFQGIGKVKQQIPQGGTILPEGETVTLILGL